ncbi:universal stress protein [Pseudoalteromonas sp. SR41-4]|uniref:universal stress protein n=1 Tax=Pseudoalteromonas sp. SR41-4 TaxID=2760950 RepID=UPI001604995D|nr:universal stress protein [Pseudoalteromonas sp. SR41-4]MBB1294403.1 universal stress protein [Pseudoalteromonas sp. SR41-4]
MDKKLLVLIDSVEFARTSILHAKHKAIGKQKHIDIVAFAYESAGNILFSPPAEQLQVIQETRLATLKKELVPLLESELSESDYSLNIIWHEAPEQWLANESDFENYEMVIKTRHIDEHCQFSELDWQLIRFTPLPLYLAADNTWRNNTNVLAALDLGSEKATKYKLNKDIIETGLAYSKHYDCQFYTCYTVHVSPILRDLGIVFSDEQVLNAFDKLPVIQRNLIIEHDIKNNLHIKAGLAEQVIPSIAAKLSAGLVIMGSVGNIGIKGKLIGNTAEKVMRLLKTDLLILPPEC